MNNLSSLIQWVKSLPLGGKALTFIAIVAMLAAAIFFSSCSSTRSMSVSVDKAEKVDIHLKDSLGTVTPFF